MDKENVKPGMLGRMEDAEFHIIVPLCKMCKNVYNIPYDHEDPTKDTMKCKVFGDVPYGIYKEDVFSCESFIGDSDKLEIFRGFLSEFQIAYVKRKI